MVLTNIFFMFFNEIYQHLDLFNLVDLYFQNDQCVMLENPTCVKVFKV